MVEHAECGGWVPPQLLPRDLVARPTDYNRDWDFITRSFLKPETSFITSPAVTFFLPKTLMLLYVANNRDVFSPVPLITVSSSHCIGNNGHVFSSPTPESWHCRFCSEPDFVENGDASLPIRTWLGCLCIVCMSPTPRSTFLRISSQDDWEFYTTNFKKTPRWCTILGARL